MQWIACYVLLVEDDGSDKGPITVMDGMGVRQFSVVFESCQEGGFYAHAPELPEIHTQGDTLDEAREMVADAIELALEVRRERGEELPDEGFALAEKVAVTFP